MGFNIGVHSDQLDNNFECYHFIDRIFYNFVNSGSMYGEKSILIQSGKYFGLDLSPLLKLVYTWDEVPEEYIKENIQNTNFLLDLVETFQNSIKEDKSVCENIEYVWYEHIYEISDQEAQKLRAEVGSDRANSFFERIEQRKKEIEENPNPWKWYFEEGQILEDLENLIKRLRCYKDKGITEVYLTAG